MKLVSKIGVIVVGVSLILPTMSFAHDHVGELAIEGNTNTEVNAGVKIKASTSIDARIKAGATTTRPKDSIRERLDEVKNKAREEKEEVRNKIEEKRDDVREKSAQNIKERLSKFVEHLMERFEAAIERLEKLADRIDSRITKMEAEGKNVTEAKGLLAEAKVKIETAASSTALIKIEANAFLESNANSQTATSTEIREKYGKIKIAVENAKEDIKAAHRALVDVINSLKPGRNKVDIKATTTATTTISN